MLEYGVLKELEIDDWQVRLEVAVGLERELLGNKERSKLLDSLLL